MRKMEEGSQYSSDFENIEKVEYVSTDDEEKVATLKTKAKDKNNTKSVLSARHLLRLQDDSTEEQSDQNASHSPDKVNLPEKSQPLMPSAMQTDSVKVSQ